MIVAVLAWVAWLALPVVLITGGVEFGTRETSSEHSARRRAERNMRRAERQAAEQARWLGTGARGGLF